MRSRGAVAALIAVSLGVCATGCTAAPRPTSSPTPAGVHITVIKQNGRVLLTHPGINGDRALLHGVLGENVAHCITIHDVVVIWPAATKLLNDGSVVDLGKTLKAGATVGVGGGVWPSDQPVPGDCAPLRGEYYDAGPAN